MFVFLFPFEGSPRFLFLLVIEFKIVSLAFLVFLAALVVTGLRIGVRWLISRHCVDYHMRASTLDFGLGDIIGAQFIQIALLLLQQTVADFLDAGVNDFLLRLCLEWCSTLQDECFLDVFDRFLLQESGL